MEPSTTTDNAPAAAAVHHGPTEEAPRWTRATVEALFERLSTIFCTAPRLCIACTSTRTRCSSHAALDQDRRLPRRLYAYCPQSARYAPGR